MKTALNRLLSYEQPQKYIVETENYSETFSTPVLTAGKSFILGYTNETTGVYNGKESPVIIFDDFTGDKKYVDFDFKVKSSAMKLLHKVNTSDNLKYLFYALQSIKYTPFSHKRIWISEYSNSFLDCRCHAQLVRGAFRHLRMDVAESCGKGSWKEGALGDALRLGGGASWSLQLLRWI